MDCCLVFSGFPHFSLYWLCEYPFLPQHTSLYSAFDTESYRLSYVKMSEGCYTGKKYRYFKFSLLNSGEQQAANSPKDFYYRRWPCSKSTRILRDQKPSISVSYLIQFVLAAFLSYSSWILRVFFFVSFFSCVCLGVLFHCKNGR